MDAEDSRRSEALQREGNFFIIGWSGKISGLLKRVYREATKSAITLHPSRHQQHQCAIRAVELN